LFIVIANRPELHNPGGGIYLCLSPFPGIWLSLRSRGGCIIKKPAGKITGRLVEYANYPKNYAVLQVK
jgi:hypothetical protein